MHDIVEHFLTAHFGADPTETGKHIVHKRAKLDRSQRPRLRNLRMMNEERSCRNVGTSFLTLLHAPYGLLWHYTRTSRLGLLHWFLRGQSQYNLSVKNWFETDVRVSFLEALCQAGYDPMREAERWGMAEHRFEICADAMNSRFWIGRANEYYESRNIESMQSGRRLITMSQR